MSLNWQADGDEIVSESWDFGKQASVCYWEIRQKRSGYRLNIYRSFKYADDPEGTWYVPQWGEDFDSIEEAKKFAEDLGRPIARDTHNHIDELLEARYG